VPETTENNFVAGSTYQPNPIDVSRIRLSAELEKLVEQLAFNTHEVWAQQRLQQGWRYGPVRNDARKEHPCLVPYDELPESEKDVDRRAVMATLKAIQALGYQVGGDSG
jgi:ryanodine receptor 2